MEKKKIMYHSSYSVGKCVWVCVRGGAFSNLAFVHPSLKLPMETAGALTSTVQSLCLRHPHPLPVREFIFFQVQVIDL